MAKKKNKKRNMQAAQPVVRLSQCVIAKNEGKNIERALSWAKDVAFEQILVDTGSTDDTVEIAERMGVKVLHFDWINDFAAAKNFAIEQASGNWIAFLDADEYFSVADAHTLMEHLKKIHSNPASRAKWFAVNCPWAQLDDSGKVFAMFAQERVFRPFVRYTGKIHEHLDLDPDRLYRVDDITIMHTGYSQAAYNETKKADRNIEMLRVELTEKPNDINVKAYLADALTVKGGEDCRAEALTLYKEVINEARRVNPVLKKKAYAAIMDNYKEIPEFLTECEEVCRKAAVDFPNDLDIEYYLGFILNKKEDYTEAWSVLRKCEESLIKSSNLDDSILISAKPRTLFIQMAIAAHGLDDVEGVVRYSTMILTEDKSITSILKHYIWTLLKHGVSEDDVTDLLKKLYDFSDPKDLMLIGRAAKDCGAVPYARRILALAQETLIRV